MLCIGSHHGGGRRFGAIRDTDSPSVSRSREADLAKLSFDNASLWSHCRVPQWNMAILRLALWLNAAGHGALAGLRRLTTYVRSCRRRARACGSLSVMVGEGPEGT